MGLLGVIRQRSGASGRPADLAIVGTAKNVGKTTTLSWLLERLAGEGPLGLTSVGRDGEDIDAVTDLPKPRIVPPAGTLVATSETSFRRSRAQLALLCETPFRTALGRVGLYRVVGSGPVEVSGPVTVDEAARVRQMLREAGATRVLVDGAIDRRASASARVADAVILATGMALLDSGGARLSPRARGGSQGARNERLASEPERIAEVARRTAEILRMLALPGGSIARVPAGETSGDGEAGRTRDAGGSALVVSAVGFADPPLGAPAGGAGAVLPGGEFVAWPGPSVLDQPERLLDWLPAAAETLVLPGALTEGVAQALLKSRRRLDLVVPDGTHVLCTPESFGRMQARGLALRAAMPITVLAVTANPTSPHSPGADPRRLLEALRAALPLPVFDLIAAPS